MLKGGGHTDPSERARPGLSSSLNVCECMGRMTDQRERERVVAQRDSYKITGRDREFCMHILLDTHRPTLTPPPAKLQTTHPARHKQKKPLIIFTLPERE